MSTPVIESIAADLKSSIDAITTVNGYNQDLTGIRMNRVAFDSAGLKDLDVLVVQGAGKAMGSNATQTNEWEQDFTLIAFGISSDTASGSIDTRLNQIGADIEKKLISTYTRGGKAIDTKIVSKQPFYDNGGRLSGITVSITVQYATVYTDPFTSRY